MLPHVLVTKTTIWLSTGWSPPPPRAPTQQHEAAGVAGVAGKSERYYGAARALMPTPINLLHTLPRGGEVDWEEERGVAGGDEQEDQQVCVCVCVCVLRICMCV